MSKSAPPKRHYSYSDHELSREISRPHEERIPRLELAFGLAIIGLILIPIVLNLCSLILLISIRPRNLSAANRNRYIFTWFLNIGAMTLHVVFLQAIRN